MLCMYIGIDSEVCADKVYVAFHDEFWGVPVYDDM